MQDAEINERLIKSIWELYRSDVLHECEYTSTCCGASVAYDMDLDYGISSASGFCGACHEHTGFECDQCRCPECDEIVRDENGEIDARVQAGLKCGKCAYSFAEVTGMW